MKRLIGLFLLLPLVASGQLMPIQRNFFSTNPAPVVQTVAGSNATVQATTTFNTRTFTVNGQTDTNVVSILATNAASGAPIYGSNVVGAVAQATHATNADNATYVTTGQLTNRVYASNVVAGGTMPMGTLATNTGWDGSVLTMTNSGTARVWSQYLTPTNVIVQNNGLGTTITPTVWLTNGTAAALGAQQYSPVLAFGGQGWRSGNSTTMPVQMGIILEPQQGSSANPIAALLFVQSISNSAWANLGTTSHIDSDGTFYCGSINGGGSVTAAASSSFRLSGRTRILSGADGDLQFMDSGQASFSRLFLGPLTAAWPALKVESTNYPTLSLRNGADNNYTSLLASNVIASANLVATNGIQIYNSNNVVEVDGLGTTITPSVWLTNGTAAALGAQQVSPALMLGGQGWRSGNSSTMPVSMGWYVLPVQGSSANPTAQLTPIVSISNAAPTALANSWWDNSGQLSANTLAVASSINGSGAIRAGTSSLIFWNTRSLMQSPADGDIQFSYDNGTGFNRLFLGSLTAAWPALKVEQTNAPVLSLRNGADNSYTSLLASNVIASANVIATNSIISYGTGTSNYIGGDLFTSGTMSPTNGMINQMKLSFTTNFTCLTNIQYYCCNGTNQVITLPDARYVAGIVFRIGTTNGYAKVIVTNATGTQTIRDGTSLSYTQVGIGNPTFISDGAHWWPASRTRVVMPNACWSLTTNVLLTADVITNVPFNQLEFNNSQGIALVAPGQFYITNAGQYMITFSAVINGGGNNTSISLWMRQSGVDIPRSRTRQVFTSATAQQCMTVNYIFNVSTNNTYFELYAGSHDTGAGIISEAANPTTYTAPAQPGVILTINKTSDTFP